MQNWVKLGRIFNPQGESLWMNSHASVPIAEHLEDDLFKIYFSTRNEKNESAIGFVVVNLMRPNTILELSKEPILSKGELGLFDDSGVMASCILNVESRRYMYYIGWNLGVTVPFRNAIGLAISESGAAFKKAFEGPVLDRIKSEPYFTASCDVMKDGDTFKIWYLSCTGWVQKHNHKVHRYHIKYAESQDGIDWDRKGIIAIDYKDDFEYAISVPRVLKEDGKYKMWFSSRATSSVSEYRIRYAESNDGVTWLRKDGEVGLEVSREGWDSKMLCYPHIFLHRGKKYMLYNGNGYGKEGFGLAVLED